VLCEFEDFAVTSDVIQETQLLLTNRTKRLEVSQGHQAWYHSMLAMVSVL